MDRAQKSILLRSIVFGLCQIVCARIPMFCFVHLNHNWAHGDNWLWIYALNCTPASRQRTNYAFSHRPAQPCPTFPKSRTWKSAFPRGYGILRCCILNTFFARKRRNSAAQILLPRSRNLRILWGETRTTLLQTEKLLDCCFFFSLLFIRCW